MGNSWLVIRPLVTDHELSNITHKLCLEVLKKDLKSQKDFVSAILELEIDGGDDSDYEDDDVHKKSLGKDNSSV